MSSASTETLPDELALALAHTPLKPRQLLTIVVDLDLRLGRIVAATSEAMLGQLRLAWWRDMLKTSPAQRPAGDAVLDGIGEYWQGREAALMGLVDGWEHLLVEPPLGETAARAFLDGRCCALLAAFENADPGYRAAAWLWACADLASNVSLDEERAMFLRLGDEARSKVTTLPRDARGLAVLGALGARALKRGGRPLMEGRGASLVATRAAIIGR